MQMRCSSVLGAIGKIYPGKSAIFTALSLFFTCFFSLNLAIPNPAKVFCRTENDMEHYFNEFCFISCKTVVLLFLQAFENCLNLSQITSRNLLMLFP